MITLIFIISLFIFGWEYALGYDAQPNQKPLYEQRGVLWFLKWYGIKWLPSFLHKPLFTCVMCMSSFYGTIFYWGKVLYFDEDLTTLTLIRWGVIVVAVCGLNRLLKGLCNLF